MTTEINDIVNAMGDIAPPNLAADWDNNGILLWLRPIGDQVLTRAMLTIDLTDIVMDEAISKGANFIVAYHPPIFTGFKWLNINTPEHAIIIRAIQNTSVIDSPHTALDAAPGGMADWLAEAFGAVKNKKPIKYSTDGRTPDYKVVVFVPKDHLERVRSALCEIPDVASIGAYSHCTFNLNGVGTFKGDETTNPAVGERGRLESVEEVRLEFVVDERRMWRVAEVIKSIHPYEEPAWDLYELTERPLAGAGQGRYVELAKPATLKTLVSRVKQHLGLESVRVAEARLLRGKKYKTAAVCPGAGGSVLEHSCADVVLTGEMRHHDILEANAYGTSVILTDHTNTERGYLPILKQKLHDKLGKSVKIDISKKDADPLQIV